MRRAIHVLAARFQGCPSPALNVHSPPVADTKIGCHTGEKGVYHRHRPDCRPTIHIAFLCVGSAGDVGTIHVGTNSVQAGDWNRCQHPRG